MIRTTLAALAIAAMSQAAPKPAPAPVPPKPVPIAVTPDPIALQRVIQTARLGICPQCGIQDCLRVDRITMQDGSFGEFHGYKCTEPTCLFQITDDQVRAVAKLSPGTADMAVWQKWTGAK